MQDVIKTPFFMFNSKYDAWQLGSEFQSNWATKAEQDGVLQVTQPPPILPPPPRSFLAAAAADHDRHGWVRVLGRRRSPVMVTAVGRSQYGKDFMTQLAP